MTFEKLNCEKILITLRHEDMETLELSFEDMSVSDEKSRKTLRRLLLLACFDAGIESKGRRFLLEALPADSGCMLLVSSEKIDKRKKYRVKKIAGFPCCVFSDADSMLGGMTAFARSGSGFFPNSLYRVRGKYYLVLDYPVISPERKALLSEYGEWMKLGSIRLSRLKEHGEPLIIGNAAAKFSKFRTLKQNQISDNAV